MPAEGPARIWTVPERLLLKGREAVRNSGCTLFRVEEGAVSVYACVRRDSTRITWRFLWVARTGDTLVSCGATFDGDIAEHQTVLELVSDQDSALTLLPASSVSSMTAGVWLNRV